MKWENKSAWMIPAAVFMFQFQSYDCLFWVTTGFNFILTFLAAFCALLLVQKERPVYIFAGFVLMIIAIFTYANGWIVWILMMLVLFRSKHHIYAWLLLVAGVLLVLWYFNLPLKGPDNGHGSAGWYQYLLYYLAFCGSAFRFFNSVTIAVIAGLIMHAGLFYLHRKKYYHKNPIIMYMILFILGSAVSTAFFRTLDGGVDQALSPRYGFYSQMLFLFIMMGMLQVQRARINRSLYKNALVFSIVWQLLSAVMFYPEAVIRKNVLKEYVKPWQQPISSVQINRVTISNPWIFGHSPVEDLNRAKANGIYNP